MKSIKNILVGVDLSEGDRFVSKEQPPPTAKAVEQAMWLASVTSARITFFHAIDVSAATRTLIEASSGGEETVLVEANKVLESLTAEATAKGIEASHGVRFGKSWEEIITQVLRDQHDFVIIGARHLTAARSVLVGSTGVKLLRLCPTPVWITQPQETQRIGSILVAHCLKEVGDEAMEFGCTLAKLSTAKLHVLHSLELPDHDSMLPERIAAEKMTEYRSDAHGHIDSQLQRYVLSQSAESHIVTRPPAQEVLKYVAANNIDLLVMGTIARSGLSGVVFGNAAERMLPQMACSLLAIKPSDFETPISSS